MATSFEAAHGGGPPDRPPASTADIQDELRDHLESRREELEAVGMSTDAAGAEALRQFGDPRRVARELFWLHNGDRIMKQRLMWLAVAIIVVALCAALFIQNRQYREMLERQQALAADLAARTQEMLAAVKEGMPTASARIHVVDDEGRPRPHWKVEIRGVRESAQLSGAVFQSRIETDSAGWADSGPLPLGEYTLSGIYPDLFDVRYGSPFKLSAFRAGQSQTIEFLQPTLERRTYTFVQPSVPEHVKIWDPFCSMVEVDTLYVNANAKYGQPTTVFLSRLSPLKVSFYVMRDNDRRQSSVGKSWAVGEWPPDGATIELGTIEKTDDGYRLVDPSHGS